MKKEIDILGEQIRSCTRCRLWKCRTIAVPGEGPADAAVLFIGEAPGRQEDQTGRPFVGRSGKLLETFLVTGGQLREQVFITSVIKCRPPKNRTPKPDELTTCINAWMWKQIDLINPKLIVILGNVALKGLLGNAPMKKYHGQIVTHRNRRFFITYHPAAAMRFPRVNALLHDDFLKIREIMHVPMEDYHHF